MNNRNINGTYTRDKSEKITDFGKLNQDNLENCVLESLPVPILKGIFNITIPILYLKLYYGR